MLILVNESAKAYIESEIQKALLDKDTFSLLKSSDYIFFKKTYRSKYVNVRETRRLKIDNGAIYSLTCASKQLKLEAAKKLYEDKQWDRKTIAEFVGVSNTTLWNWINKDFIVN